MTEKIDITEIKAAHTRHPVADFITARFSPRAFSEKNLSEEAMNTLFEAASWAPSCFNEQPWEYYFALKNTEGFEKIWSCLMAGNQPWTTNAAALVVTVVRKTFTANGKPNATAEHDLGLSNATLLLQARSMDIFGHAMAGFDKNKTAEALNLDENRAAVCVIALGYLGDLEQLEEPFKSREMTSRNRKPLDQFVHPV